MSGMPHEGEVAHDHLEGFKTDRLKWRKTEDLPKAANKYIKFIGNAADCPIKYVIIGNSAGASEEDRILKLGGGITRMNTRYA